MNYNDKIQELLARGIVSNVQAESLLNSLKSTGETENLEVVDNKKWLELFFYMLIVGFVLILFFSMGESSTTVVDVSLNLNETAHLGGISSRYSLLVSLLGLILVTYTLFYLISLSAYNKLTKLEQTIFKSRKDIQNAFIYKKDLEESLKNLAQTFAENEKNILSLAEKSELKIVYKKYPELQSGEHTSFILDELSAIFAYINRLQFSEEEVIKKFETVRLSFPGSLGNVFKKFKSYQEQK